MKSFTLSFLTLLMLLSEATSARPGIHRYDSPALSVRELPKTPSSIAFHSKEGTDPVLIKGRQNGGGRAGGFRGGGRAGNKGGAGFGGAGAGVGAGEGVATATATTSAAAATSSTAADINAGNDVAAGDINDTNGANSNNTGVNNKNNGGDNSGAVQNGGNNNNAGNGAPGPAVPILQFNGGTQLNPAVIQNTEANPNATANQAASAVSNDNFIDFCVGQTITNGLQNKAGSCNPVPIGQIPSTQNMVSTMFVSPKNMETIKAGQTFTIGLQTVGMTMGSFVNAQKNYYAAPQQIDSSGQIVGHAHVTLQPMKAIDDTSVLDPNTFTFFKGMDLSDVNGLSTIDVQGGVPAGAYRLCTIMSASNHQSVILPVAQRGAENTCSYFTAA
ncbi:uncharacterized protein I206_100548 [Kwoniella pini CBS 10737]|uniref:Ribosomal protein s17 n=1 Tax=Kwoniella pini CBS 10737 TaxID=1296096 RepID=A0A1B9IDI4_9TREE|nr:uncharacterized protein I206_00777 [Kwoniella pini CBS 10737]OCF53474.1 hypothetical protein I206_00777 [Kwoniella pini CBS 10737]